MPCGTLPNKKRGLTMVSPSGCRSAEGITRRGDPCGRPWAQGRFGTLLPLRDILTDEWD